MAEADSRSRAVPGVPRACRTRKARPAGLLRGADAQAAARPPRRRDATAYELALSLTDGDVAAYWRPTRANYLGRITRDQLLALGRELLGEQWAQARRKDKKGELADQLDRAFADPERHARTPRAGRQAETLAPARHGVRHRRSRNRSRGGDARKAA